MFRRTSKVDVQPADLVPKGPGAKGRPTPTRKEAEAARRERAKAGMDKKAAAKLLRERRAESNSKVREGMKTGEERYLPKRDQGPVKRFIRNYVDARLSIAEFLLPLLVVIMVLQYSGNPGLLRLSNALWATTLIVVALDTAWMLLRLKRALRAKFPDENLKGTTFYTLFRAIQVRFLRMPKPQVKIGGSPR
ncbi:MAG: rane protein [Marmoricola sp.]|nr:rane protein [Marmoricola sp.]